MKSVSEGGSEACCQRAALKSSTRCGLLQVKPAGTDSLTPAGIAEMTSGLKHTVSGGGSIINGLGIDGASVVTGPDHPE